MRLLTRTCLLLGAVLALGACDGPDCSAGECLVFVTEPPSGLPATQAQRDYFFEIALNSEDGSSHPLLRWEKPVRIHVRTDANHEDYTEIDQVVGELRNLTGLDIARTTTGGNVGLYVVSLREFPNYGGPASGGGGYFQIFPGYGTVDSARVLIGTEGTPTFRRHIIREELTQMLGLPNDSYRYPDSIFYQDYSTVTAFSSLDRFVIRTAHDDRLRFGMSRSEIEEALEW